MNGNELRELRQRMNWTQSQLATQLDLTSQYISMLERDEKTITPALEKTLRELASPDDQGRYVPNEQDLAQAQEALLYSLKKMPDLCLNGLYYTGYDKNEFEAKKRHSESYATLFSLDSLSQIATAIKWIQSSKKVNEYKCNSYGAKHRAEKWGKENNYSPYVANGALIVAVVFCKVKHERLTNSPNVKLGIDPDPMPEPKPRTFAYWLFSQTKRDGPIGDLARDATNDKTFPINTSSRPKLRSYMDAKNACNEAINALEAALKEWRSLKLEA